jgi:hypothetical protein
MDIYIIENKDVNDTQLGNHFDKLYDKEVDALDHYHALKVLNRKKEMKL